MRKIKMIFKILISVLLVSVVFVTLSISSVDNTQNMNISYRNPVTSTTFLSEEGTESDPYVIGSKNDMETLSNEVAAGNSFFGKVIVVDSGITEIDLGNFDPIGKSGRPFSGTFDGYGTNFNLNINKQTTDYVGLFGFADRGVIENLSVSGNIIGRDRVAGVLGQQNTGSIVRNVYNTATIIGNSRVGGIIGFLNVGTLRDSYNRGEIIGDNSVGELLVIHMIMFIVLIVQQ